MLTKTHDHPNTIAAGLRHKKSKSREDRKAIAEFIARQAEAGAIEEEILRNCPDVLANSVRLRLRELSDDYYCITDKEGERRRNLNGNTCKVWHITDKGLIALGRPLTDFHVPVKK